MACQSDDEGNYKGLPYLCHWFCSDWFKQTGERVKDWRRTQTINDTKIKYISVADKIYEVTSIQWLHFYLEAKETNLSAEDVEETELWDISYFKDYRIRLVNKKGKTNVIDIAEWIEKKRWSDGNIKCAFGLVGSKALNERLRC